MAPPATGAIAEANVEISVAIYAPWFQSTHVLGEFERSGWSIHAGANRWTTMRLQRSVGLAAQLYNRPAYFLS